MLAVLVISSYGAGGRDGSQSPGAQWLLYPHRHELFAYFECTDSKSRQNFLVMLRVPDTDYTINDEAVTYCQLLSVLPGGHRAPRQGCVSVRRRRLRSVPFLHALTSERHCLSRLWALSGEFDCALGVAGYGVLSDGACISTSLCMRCAGSTWSVRRSDWCCLTRSTFRPSSDPAAVLDLFTGIEGVPAGAVS